MTEEIRKKIITFSCVFAFIGTMVGYTMGSQDKVFNLSENLESCIERNGTYSLYVAHKGNTVVEDCKLFGKDILKK